MNTLLCISVGVNGLLCFVAYLNYRGSLFWKARFEWAVQQGLQVQSGSQGENK